MKMQSYPKYWLCVLSLLIPFCASSAWREGFHGKNTLHLVGEGHTAANLPQVQAEAMAREAAIVDAMSHWPRFCAAQTSETGIATFRVENQKRRKFVCDGAACRARIVIEKVDLRKQCSG